MEYEVFLVDATEIPIERPIIKSKEKKERKEEKKEKERKEKKEKKEK